MISYEKELYIDNKWNNHLKTSGIINNIFRPHNTLKKTRMKLYNSITLPSLSYGSGNWTNKTRDARRLTASELRCMRKTAGYTWTDYIKKTETAKEINIAPGLYKI